MGEVLDTEAQRDLPALLRRAAAGERITIVSDGRPVAQLGPAPVSPWRALTEEEKAQRRAAFEAVLAHLNSVKPRVVGPWTREDLYERDPR